MNISTQEASVEIRRDQFVRRLRRTHVVADGRRLADNVGFAQIRGALRIVAIRLASRLVRIRNIHDRVVVNGAHHRTLRLQCRMSN